MRFGKDRCQSGARAIGASFRFCRVSDDEFARAKGFADHVVITESSFEGAEVAIAFKPRASWDKAFQFFRLYR
jgi:hypothetical protein